ncbi:MAG: DUF2807 domain-containing protein [Bacteroidales bacterium]|nr:DUF2807 domain-containing protein [Bacteroidales bacterium]MCF8455534.1 DUF2807 domain-containing protein [Bacteroidales bacterium]
MKNRINLIVLVLIVITTCSFSFIESSEFLAIPVKEKAIAKPSPTTNALKDIEQRKVADFSRIGLSVSADVYITQGNQTSLEIEASEKTLQNLVTKVKDGELEIKWKDNDYSNGEINIKITMKEIEELSIAGSGNIFANSSIKCNEIKLSIAGSGSIKLKDISAKEIESSVAGSGNINLGGSNPVSEHTIEIAGSGDVSAKKLPTDEVTVNIAGSGDCYVHAVKELDVNIAGSGDVYYFGSPELEKSIIGSGDVEKL